VGVGATQYLAGRGNGARRSPGCVWPGIRGWGMATAAGHGL